MSLNVNSLLRKAKKLEGSGNHQEAALIYRRVLEKFPGNKPALQGLRAIERENCPGHKDTALQFEHEVRRAVESYNSGRLRESLGLARQLVTRVPNDPLLQNLLGAISGDLKLHDEAIAAFERAVALKPDYTEAHRNVAEVYSRLKMHEQAIGAYSRILESEPGSPEAIVNLLYEKVNICDWQGLEQWLEKLRSMDCRGRVINPGRVLSFSDDPQWHRALAENFCAVMYPPSSQDEVPERAPKEKLRVGFFSPDFRMHAVSFLICRCLELMDPNRFEIYAYSYVNAKDVMRDRLKSAVDKFHDVSKKSDTEVVALSRNDELDIAVDLAGHTDGARPAIFSRRVAPVQVSYLGYPGTMASPYLDYLFCDEVIVPANARENYTERLIFLPHTYQATDNTRLIVEDGLSREVLGLPAEGFVFCCFNGTLKIMPREFSIWMRLLQAVEGSVLWLFVPNDLAVKNLRSTARELGVNPDRLVFADRINDQGRHLARYRFADLFLDTFIYNAHTTGSDALWAGLPVLTLKGRSFASRVGASLLSAVGLEELVTNTEVEYEQLALALARDKARLVAIREKLENNRLSTPLFDTEGFTRNFETALQSVAGQQTEVP